MLSYGLIVFDRKAIFHQSIFVNILVNDSSLIQSLPNSDDCNSYLNISECISATFPVKTLLI